MKKNLLSILAAALSLVVLLAALPASALVSPAWTVPSGYNALDYNKLAAFLETADENGVKNGTKGNPAYNPNDPQSWNTLVDPNEGDTPNSVASYLWMERDGEQRIASVVCYGLDLVGALDLSGCTGLMSIDCARNRLTSINVSGCTRLGAIIASNNAVTALDLSGCAQLLSITCQNNQLSAIDLSGLALLRSLTISGNRLTSLNVSANPALTLLHCADNSLTSLNLSANTMLSSLNCVGNMLTELDLTSTQLIYKTIRAEGSGTIACAEVISADTENPSLPAPTVYAAASDGYRFDGWYNQNGQRISTSPEYAVSESDGVVFIARFVENGGSPSVPGDVDGNGSVTVSDAILILRMAMGLMPVSNIEAADVNGDGSVTVVDAITTLRAALGLN